MGKIFLISQVILFLCSQLAAQPSVNFIYDNSWGPGRYNRVSVIIDFGSSAGFARFSQDFPSGLEIIKERVPGGDFDIDRNRLNIVWMALPGNGKTEFSYMVKPESGMKGTVEMEGTLTVIRRGSERTSLRLNSLVAAIEGTNGFLPEDLPRRKESVASAAEKPVSEPESESRGVVFRIQVSTSSELLSDEEIRKELDLDSPVKITTVKAGNTYKYQAGEFTDYESAGRFLSTVRAAGIKDAFIVAYKDGEQIPPGRARQMK